MPVDLNRLEKAIAIRTTQNPSGYGGSRQNDEEQDFARFSASLFDTLQSIQDSLKEQKESQLSLSKSVAALSEQMQTVQKTTEQSIAPAAQDQMMNKADALDNPQDQLEQGLDAEEKTDSVDVEAVTGKQKEDQQKEPDDAEDSDISEDEDDMNEDLENEDEDEMLDDDTDEDETDSDEDDKDKIKKGFEGKSAMTLAQILDKQLAKVKADSEDIPSDLLALLGE